MINRDNIIKLARTGVKTMLGYKIPMKVTQFITTRCNLNCEYCGRKNLDIGELETDEVEYYIQEFKKMGTLFWSFNGGECLLRDDLGELIRYVRGAGLKCNIVTNGILVPHRIDWLKDIDLVITSIDGPEGVQDKIRGKGVYKKNVEALDVLAKNKIKTVVVSVITNENIDKLGEVLRLVEFYGLSWDVQPVVIHKGDKEQNAKRYQFDTGRFVEAVDWIIGKKKNGAPVFGAFDYLEDMKRFPDCKANENCWAGRLFCALGPDGSIYPCGEFMGTEQYKIKPGTNDIRGAFNSIPDMSRCHDCYFSCYSEYNLILNHKIKSFFRISKNLIRRKWFWS